jgi:hypothetical protein
VNGERWDTTLAEKTFKSRTSVQLQQAQRWCTWTSKTELGNCNGTIGVITDSTPIRVSFNVPGDIVDLEIGSIVNYFTINGNSASRRQFPLQNCYGLTVKTQGLTLRDVSLNLDGQNFSAGQAYVAPSRCSVSR